MCAGHVHHFGGNHLQPDHGALGATNQIDHFIKAHADHIDSVFFPFLSYTNDTVGGLKYAGAVSRAAGDQAGHFHVLAVILQHGTDTFE